jgi:hypothetical protein
MMQTIERTTKMLEMLPESEQIFAEKFVKRLVLAWDPDFTKATPAERAAFEAAEKDMEENGTVSHDSINWD